MCQINAAYIQEGIIDVVINSLFAAHQFIDMIKVNLVDGLTFTDQRRDDFIEPAKILFVRQDTVSGFRNTLFSEKLCISRVISTFRQCAFIKILAGGTDIERRSLDLTDFLPIVWTQGSTFTTKTAFCTICTGLSTSILADALDLTGFAVYAIIKAVVWLTGLFIC